MNSIRQKILKPADLNLEMDWLIEDRITLLLISVVYPFWTIISATLAFENTETRPIGRISVGVVAAIVLFLSFRNKWVRKNLSLLATACLCLLITNFFYVLYVNSFHFTYAIGGVIVVFCVTGMVNIPKHLIFVGTYSLIAAWLASASSLDTKTRTFYVIAMFTALIINYISANRRLSNVQKIKIARKTIANQKVNMATHSRLSAIGELAAGVAHEINTPLTTITLNTEICRDILDKNPTKAKALLSGIEETVERIAKIINGLKAFARDAGSDPMLAESIDQILEDVCLLCEAKLGHQSISLIISKNAPDLILECRRVQIAQLLMNLIHNSAQALRLSQDRKIRIEISSRDENIEIIIEDNGPGIESTIHEKIFQPFFTTHDLGTGPGLGLSISRGVAEAHQGHLTLESSSKSNPTGAKFVLLLPKQQSKNLKLA
jgi:signal transduction histidine kinase